MDFVPVYIHGIVELKYIYQKDTPILIEICSDDLTLTLSEILSDTDFVLNSFCDLQIQINYFKHQMTNSLEVFRIFFTFFIENKNIHIQLMYIYIIE